MYEKLEEFTFKELLGYSIDGEEKAKEAYIALTGPLPGLASDRFETLAHDEEMHKEELLKIYEKEFGNRNYEVPDSDDLPPHEGKFISGEIKGIKNLVGALKSAMKAEQDAYKLYKHLAKANEEYETLFNYIAMMEKGHHESLAEERGLYEEEIGKEEKAYDFLDFHEGW